MGAAKRGAVVGEGGGKVIVFVGQQSDIVPLLAVARKQKGEVIFVAASASLTEEVERLGVDCRNLGSYLDLGDDEEIKKTATDWFDAWGGQCQWDGKSYKEAAELEGVGAWWFILPVLIPDVLRCIQFAEEVLALLEVERPTSLCLVDVESRRPYPLRLGLDRDLPGKMAMIVCLERGINIRRVDPPLKHRLGGWASCAKARWGMAFYFAFIQGWVNRWRVWLTRGKKKAAKKGGRGTIALVTSPVYWRQSVNLSGAKVTDDAIAGTCMEALGAQGYDLVGIDVDLSAPNRRQFDILRQKRLHSAIQWRAIEHYYRPDKKKWRLRMARRNESAQKIGGSAVCRQGMRYRNIDIAPLLVGRFSYLFAHYLPGAMAYLDALENGIACEEVELILIVYEEGPAGRAATLVGQRQGVPTLALQHGTLSSPFAPAYYLSAVAHKAQDNPAICPVPTVTAVYGEHTRAMLVEVSTYPPESVVTVGMPAYDGVFRTLQATSRDDARDALELADHRPMALIISQPFLSRENRDYFASAVIDAAVRTPDIQWVIKLHPSEEAGAWARYLRKKAVNIRVFGGDLHPLLIACDLVVSWYSTVILEAALFARPVISVEIPGCLAPEDYLRDGLVVSAKDAVGIETQVNSLLYDHTLRQQHLRQAKQALGHYIYKPDGSASARVVDLVETLVQKGRGESPEANL